MGLKVTENDKVIPVVDCPVCGAKDVPLSLEVTMEKEGHSDIEIWSCSSCGKVPNIGKDLKVKRYISIKDLKKMGYSEALGGKE